jgi:tRNA pseudouridine synthase 10
LVEVDELSRATGTDVVTLKEDRAAKTYRVLLTCAPPVEEAKLKTSLQVLGREPIAQRTPERVVHRRADTTRTRRIISAEVVALEGERAEIRVTAEAGTYIKEWVHGDHGRTRPSLAERLEATCVVLELDVLDVHDDR